MCMIYPDYNPWNKMGNCLRGLYAILLDSQVLRFGFLTTYVEAVAATFNRRQSRELTAKIPTVRGCVIVRFLIWFYRVCKGSGHGQKNSKCTGS